MRMLVSDFMHDFLNACAVDMAGALQCIGIM